MQLRHHVICALCALVGWVWAGEGFADALKAPSGGVVRALVVGINAYPGLPGKDLKGAVADAQDLTQALRKVGVSVEPILDAQATRARFIKELDRLLEQSKAGDYVILAFAGHGMSVPEYKQWQGVEASGKNEQLLFSGFGPTWPAAGEVFVNKELRAYMSRFDAKGVDMLVIMDACYGGGMTRAIAPTYVGVRGSIEDRASDPAVRARFSPIAMTEREARTVIDSLSRVSFFAGASETTIVPEVLGLVAEDANQARGALSYFMARAIEGEASKGGDLDFGGLFKFLVQNVNQRTSEQQRIVAEPHKDPTIQRRVILKMAEGGASPPSEPPAVKIAGDAVPIFVAGAAANPSWRTGRAPSVVVDQPERAELIWSLKDCAVYAHGDLVMSKVDGSLIGDVIDRSWAIRALQKLSMSRVQRIELREGGRLYVSGEIAAFVLEEVKDRYVVVFNIAANGQVQMVQPGPRGASDLAGLAARVLQTSERQTLSSPVVAPFGADHAVAVSSAVAPTELLRWLVEHDQKPDAALVPEQIAKLMNADPSARLGDVGLYTAATAKTVVACRTP